MKFNNNNALVEALEKRVENQLKEVIGIFQNLNETTLLQASPTGGWSIAECLWHLNSYANYYMPRLQKSIGEADGCEATQSFNSSWQGNYFTQLMEPGAKMKKMSAFRIHRPVPVENPHAVVAEFIQHLEDLLKLLRIARCKNLEQSKVSVSIMPLIKLRAGDALQFLIAHNERHIIQAKRNI